MVQCGSMMPAALCRNSLSPIARRGSRRTRKNRIRGEGVGDSGTDRPPMPMPSASDRPAPWYGLGRVGLWRRRRGDSVSLEHRGALLDEGAGGFLVVLGLAGADHARGLRVERLGKRALLGDLHVLLHVPPR